MRRVLGLLGVAVLAALASTSPGAIIALTDTTGDPASVSAAPGTSITIDAVLTLDAGQDASGIGFLLHSSQNNIFTITGRTVDGANPFTDLSSTNAVVFANTPQLNPTNGADLGGSTPDALNQPAATYPLYTLTLAIAANAPQGTYHITVANAVYTNEAFDTVDIGTTTYDVTVVPEPVSFGMVSVVLGGLLLRRRPA